MADATPNLAKSRPSIRTFTGWTILFMVLLRIAIGWHFFYEGAWKLMQDDWRATGYLVASSGPFRPIFQAMVPDVDGLKALTRENMYTRMDQRHDLAVKHYNLTDEQQKIFRTFLERKKHGIEDDNNVNAIFGDPKFQEQIADYRMKTARGEAADRDAIPARFDPVFKDLDETVTSNALPEQLANGDPPPPPSIVPDKVESPDDLSWLTREHLYGLIDARYNQLRGHYRLDPNKYGADTDANRRLKRKIEEIHQSSFGWRYREQKKVGGDRDKNNVDAIWADPDFQSQLSDYKDLLAHLEKQETNTEPDYNTERLTYDYGKKARARAALLARFETPLNDIDPKKMATFSEKMGLELSEGQLKAGPLPGEKSPTWWIDWANMAGLTLVGACLMLGLFTRLASLGGVGLLALYYFAMPPFPGLPESPMAEGHYLIVNKNLIEAIALLMIATTRVGRWGGLDAYFRAGACPKTEACAAPAATGAKG